MDIEQTQLPTEHLFNIIVNAVAGFDGSIQLGTTITLSGQIEINGIDYNNFLDELRDVLQKYQK